MKFRKNIAWMLCTAVLIGCIGMGTAYAVSERTKSDVPDSTVTTPAADENAMPSKDETVYVIAGADGSVQKIIVSDWIKNSLGSASLNDQSQLTNVENIKGDETYTMNGEHMRVWDAQGKDIYYQGNIEKELPVDMSVSYMLDGNSISPAELAGKNGHVVIRFTYRNQQYETVEIDGKQEKIYVPFAMLTGILLDNEVFTNVEVSNGKLINDGDRIAVIGIAFPGLQDNLMVDKEKLEIPDYVEISADVKNFEMMNTVTIATNSVFSKIDTGILDSVNGLTDAVGELGSAMNQLLDGSSRLYDGLCTLLDKSGELIAGIDQLAEGAAKLKNGTASLKEGSATLADGAGNLAGGLDQLIAENDTLNAGAKQVFESLLFMADTQIAAAGLTVPKLTIENYTQVLNSVISSLDESTVRAQAEQVALTRVSAAVREQKDKICAGVTEAVRAQVEEQVLAAMGMTKAEYDAGVAGGSITEEMQAQVTGAVEAQMASENVQTLIASKTEEEIQALIEQNLNSDEVQAQIEAAVEKASAGAQSLTALKGQLDRYKTFYEGLGTYTAGVSSAGQGAHQVSEGAVQLKNGSAELDAGMQELYNGILTLKNGAPALVTGVTELRNGSMQLCDGLKQFNEQGVQKLTNAVKGDIAGLLTRVKATVDVSKDYTSFSGISEDMSGQVKFIYRTEAIEIKK